MSKSRPGSRKRRGKLAFAAQTVKRLETIEANRLDGSWHKDADRKARVPEGLGCKTQNWNIKAMTHKRPYVPWVPVKVVQGHIVRGKAIRAIPKASVTDNDLYRQKPDMTGATAEENMVRTGTSKRGLPRFEVVGKFGVVPKDGGR